MEIYSTSESDEEQRVYDEFLRYWKGYMQTHEEVYALLRQNKQEQAVAILATRSREFFSKASEELEKAVTLNMQGREGQCLTCDRRRLRY